MPFTSLTCFKNAPTMKKDTEVKIKFENDWTIEMPKKPNKDPLDRVIEWGIYLLMVALVTLTVIVS